MNIDKKELKIISMEFRTVANRLITCNYYTGMDLLKKFIAYIDGNEIISEYIQGYVDKDDFTPPEMGQCIISTGNTKQEEISFTYQYLRYCIENYNCFYSDMAFGYGRDTESSINEFCNRIVLPFVNYIEGYLTEIGIRMGYDEDKKFMINVNGGVVQVNLANDNASINASQDSGLNMAELEHIISNVKSNIPSGMSEKERSDVIESIDAIKEEIHKKYPRRGFVNLALKGLLAINGSAQFGAAVATLVQFVKNVI